MSWSRYFRRRRWDQERLRELQSYLDTESSENIARGMGPEEARHAAHRKLGNPTLIREDIYHMNTIRFIETLWQDLRYAARQLRLNPGFALVAILSLALGIGANTAIFQLLDAVRIRTLPVKDPWELAYVRIPPPASRTGGFSSRYSHVTNPMWEQIRDRQQAFSSIFAWSPRQFNLAVGGETHYAPGIFASGEFFSTLGVEAILGRVFTSADDRRGCGSPGVVISYSFWQSEYGGSASALGRKLTLNGHPFEVIGVTPAGFFGIEVGRNFDFVVPICSEPVILGEESQLDRRERWWLAVVGRLKPGWPVARASANLAAIAPGIFETTLPANYDAEDAKNYLAFKLRAFPAGSGFSTLRETYENPLWLLLATAGLVLLIACANLANLLLARASTREREIAVRLALGASRGRLIRQLLAESLLMATVGAALGAILAGALSQSLIAFLSTQGNQLFVDLQLDWRVLGFTAGLAVFTCALFGLTPALRATRTAPGAVMKSSGRGLTGGRERFGLRRVLVAGQVALSLVLLVGALLFSRSLRNLATLDAGFQQDGILITNVNLTKLSLPKERRQQYKSDLVRRIRTIPGVEAAADINNVPVSGNWSNTTVVVDQRKGVTYDNVVSPGYFKTLGTPLVAGRDFDEHDTPSSPKVAIVNESFMREFMNGKNPVGRTFHFQVDPGEPDPSYQVIGLVKDTKYADLRENFKSIVYAPTSQDASPDLFATIMIRSNGPIATLIPAVKRTVAEANPDIELTFRIFKTLIREGLVRERLMATLSGFFGFLAALLATIGLYGVMSYMVAQRQNEIGIRMALGAGRSEVLGLILREAGLLLAVGLSIGTVLALAAARTGSSMLFGLQPHDPATLSIAVAALGLVALAASYLPARRAARLDPVVALREE